MRYGAKRDGSEPAIVAALEKAGATVQRLDVRDGPDLLVGRLGISHLLECKSPGQKRSEGQERWHLGWRGGPVYVVTSAEEALLAIGAWRPKR